MGGRWNPIGFQFLYLLILIFMLQHQVSFSLNSEGLSLLEFQARVHSDPHAAFANWNKKDTSPCLWSGVHCHDGKVYMLDMTELSLEGTLAPELGKLTELRSLILPKNRFYGAIPKEFGELTKLEVLDLRSNELSRTIPVEIGEMLSLKRLLLCDNKFEGSIPLELKRLNLLYEMQFDEDLTSAVASEIRCVNRKFGHCLKQLDREESFMVAIKEVFMRYFHDLPVPLYGIEMPSWFKFGEDSLHTPRVGSANLPALSSETRIIQNIQNLVSVARRRLLEQSSNLLAPPANDVPQSNQVIALPTARSSGAFPAVPNAKKKQYPSPAPAADTPKEGTQVVNSSQNPTGGDNTASKSLGSSRSIWKYFYIIPVVIAVLIIVAATHIMCRTRAVRTIGPWKTGLSGQLQKAFITGVPKLNRSELETACEDFSNIIDTVGDCTIYKGTLSSGVEIAVASTTVRSSKDWSKTMEMAYRRKIDLLSRVNHKNFVNLIGFCEEEVPFNRMMVFEYAPNGTLFEHLHIEEMEHLDWNARIRIIMGAAYCLQYMHHDLNPPVSHSNLTSRCIYLTDDYAAKVAEISFPTLPKSSKYFNDNDENSELPPQADPETNIYSFGVLLLEIISGKLAYSEEHGPLEKWAAEYLNDKRNISSLIDSSLKSFKNNELEVVCEVIQECIQPDPRQRPTMKDIVAKLRQVINISPDQATPRLSPLWWAELEILSAEAT